MDEIEQEDWLDRKLREAAPYIDDDGFTARVMEAIPAPLALPADAQSVMQADGVRDATLIVLWRHHPHLARKFTRDFLQHLQPRRINPVVIRQQHSIQHDQLHTNVIASRTAAK